VLRRRLAWWTDRVRATAAEVISTSTPVTRHRLGRRRWLGKNGHQEGDRREKQHERAHCPCPVWGHPVAGQVTRDKVEQSRHGGGPGEPQDRDRAQVVQGAEAVAQLLVRQEGQGPPVGRTTGPERVRSRHRGGT
jgi:hypothetical protein